MIKKILKTIFKTLLVFVLLIVLYLGAAYTLPYITVNNNFSASKEGIKIFIVSNGVHTDVVLPAKNKLKNWQLVFPKETFDVTDSSFCYTAFGWGDKGFYLNTPTWADLKFSTAFKATFGLSGTAMHVRYLREPKLNEKCAEIMIDENRYKKLVSYIEESFEKKENNFVRIDHRGYGDFDRFFEARGVYSAIKTCNVWTNMALKHIGVKVAFWSPFSPGLMSSLKR